MPRDLALVALDRLNHGRGLPEQYLERAFNESPEINNRDRALAVHLVQGVLRWRLRLDWILKQNITFPFKKIDPSILNILRIAIFQIYFMDRIPESAAVNEAVKQAKRIAAHHVVSSVNAILRNICRKKEKVNFPNRERNLYHYLSVYHSYPEWLVKKWGDELGIQAAEQLLIAGNEVPNMIIRTNILRIDRSSLLKRLSDEGVRAIPTHYAPEGIRLREFSGPVHRLKTFKEGLFQVQDEAAQICSHLLYPKKREFILDVCAGQGGKTTHLAEITHNKVHILALDINHPRLLRLLQNSHRLGIKHIQPIMANAEKKLSNLFKDSFEGIMVDPPCSALGTLSRHPDAKWIKDEAAVNRLADAQKNILDNVVPLIRKGGRMLYITCTISKVENEDVAKNLLAEHRDMDLVNLKDHAPEWGRDLVDHQGFLKTLPHIHSMDGFFAGLFVKKGK
jgi:16S rRNA (cytosine967-C5)-methyltransferase